MNYPLTTSGQVRATAAGLAEVADRYGRVAVISRAGSGTAALLDQTEQELSSRGIRCVRVQGPASGGLALRGLIAQLTGQPDPGALADGTLADRDLKAGFMALTEPGQGYGRVALLVAEAHSLLPSAVRYIQLACQSSPTKLCLVLAGQPGLATVLAGDELAPLRGAMHVMELPEPAGQGLFDQASAVSEPRAMPAASRRGASSSLVRLGVAALIIPIVGLIWWRHLPAAPVAAVPSQDAPSVPSVVADMPLAAPPAAAAALAERAAEPAPSEPDFAAAPQAGAGLPAADPPPPDTAPEPSVSEVPAKPEAPTESSAAENAEQPDAVDPPDVAEQSVGAAEPPAVAEPPAAEEPPAVAAEPERSGPPPQETDVAEAPAPKPAVPVPVPDATPPPPDPTVAAQPPPPHGTLTVMGAPPAHGGAKRATAALAAPAAASLPARAAEGRINPADERRCRDIVLKAQLGKDPSDADKQFLRNGCHSG